MRNYTVIGLLCLSVAGCGEKNRYPQGIDHVVVIGIDALSVQGLRAAKTPCMDSLIRHGAVSYKVRTVAPSTSTPNWNAMLYGAGPEISGPAIWHWDGSSYMRNLALAPVVMTEHFRFPNIFRVIRDRRPEAEMGAIYEWWAIGMMFEPELLNVHETRPSALETARRSAEYIREKKPHFLFIHLDEVDGHGHRDGHMSAGYLRSVEEADTWVRLIVDAIREAGMAERTLIMIVSDHGGIYRGHGDAAWEEVTVPLVFSGAGVRKNYEIRQQVYVFDMAASVAFALGLDAPHEWTGRPTKAAFAGFDEPANRWNGLELLPPPVFPVEDRPHGRLFVDRPAEVNIAMPVGAEGVIRYTTDGSLPVRDESEVFTAPFTVDHSVVINARLFSDKGESPNVTAYYRVADTKAGHGLNFKIYQQPEMKEMPDFRALRPAGEGVCHEFSLHNSPDLQTLRGQYGQHYALTFTGYLRIDDEGTYTFRLHSEDGSKLYIGRELVVNKSGTGESLSAGKIELKAGMHPVRLEYFKQGGGGEMTLCYEGPNTPSQIVPADKLFRNR
ncbi:MAG: alkaline phosphatase family protein [Tannerella sp.]|jgi:hypothetical protein|nr:alkaline phosphatase family protein [Tannerella sp.]